MDYNSRKNKQLKQLFLANARGFWALCPLYGLSVCADNYLPGLLKIHQSSWYKIEKKSESTQHFTLHGFILNYTSSLRGEVTLP
jgi:hypothetical protein